MSQIQLFLLGVPEVRLNGQPVHLRTRKMLALLAYLAVEGGPHSRDELAELLWPGPQPSARAALRLALHHIQAALGREIGLSTMRESVELTRHARLWVDVLELETGEASPDRSPDPAAVALWRGDFLHGLSVKGSPSWDDWVGARALEYAEHFGTLLARLTRAQLTAGQVTDAAATARRWMDHDPLSEEAYKLLAGAQRAAGLGTRALETERLGREVLRRELGAEPVPETPLAPVELPQFLVGGPLIGRQAEFGRLVAAYRQAAGGAPQALLLSGEPGIGKTRLAGEVLVWARDRGATLLRGRAPETASQPYAALVEALGREQDVLRARLGPPHLEDLARVLPGLQDSPVPPAAGDLRARLLEALSAAVTALTLTLAGETLVLLVDDLQWADTSTLDALLHLAARLAETPIPLLLLFTARSEYLGTGTPLAGWLARVRRHLPLHEEALGPLDAAGTGHLLGRSLPHLSAPLMDRLTAWLHGETGGHPLYLTETLKGLLESGAVLAAPQGPQLDERRLPRGAEGVRATIGERLSRLAPASLALAQGAAVVGQAAPFEVLRGVADLDGETALTGYEELLRTGLLLELGEHAHLSHDRVRETVRDALSGPRRQLLHRRAFRVLEQRDTPPAVLAGHALDGGLRDEAKAWFFKAADAANRVGAYIEVSRDIEQALKLEPETREHHEWRFRLIYSVANYITINDGKDCSIAIDFLNRQAVYAHQNGLLEEECLCILWQAKYFADLLEFEKATPLLEKAYDLSKRFDVVWATGMVITTHRDVAMQQWKWEEAERLCDEDRILTKKLKTKADEIHNEGVLAYILACRGMRKKSHSLYSTLMNDLPAITECEEYIVSVKQDVVLCIAGGAIDNALAMGALDEAMRYAEYAGELLNDEYKRIPAIFIGKKCIALMEMGSNDAAVAGLKECLGMSRYFDHKPSEYHGALALASARIGDFDEAIGIIKSLERFAADKIADYGMFNIFIGDALKEMGDVRGALFYYQRDCGSTDILQFRLRGREVRAVRRRARPAPVGVLDDAR